MHIQETGKPEYANRQENRKKMNRVNNSLLVRYEFYTPEAFCQTDSRKNNYRSEEVPTLAEMDAAITEAHTSLSGVRMSSSPSNSFVRSLIRALYSLY